MAKQNKSDWMSEHQDKELERIEKDISSLYSNAAKEVNAELAKFTESYEKQLVAKQAELDAGDITKTEYQVWVQKQMLQTDRYKATVDHMTDILVKSDKAAMAVVNGKLPTVVAESYNFSQALGFEAANKAGLSVGTFQVYNAKSVEKIIRDNPKLLKEVDVPEDKKWNQEHINREITTGLLKGESIPKVSERLQRVTTMDKNAATRNARTAMTAAENVGRNESAEELKAKGIPVEEVWSAAIDKRTRETHILLDGTVKDEDGFFGADILLHPLRYPADPDGDPEEIYNCRCRLNIQIKGIDHSNDKELYERFMKQNDPDSYKRIREVDEPKEEAYQKNKEKAEASLPARQERIRELKAQTQEQTQTESKKSTSKAKTEPAFVPSAKQIAYEEKIRSDSIERATYFDGNGNALLSAKGDAQAVGFDPYEFNHKVEQVVWDGEQVDFTHNHPFNEIFSPEDVENLETLENHSCSAVCANGNTYRLVRNQAQSGNLVYDEELGDFRESEDIRYIAEDYRTVYLSFLDKEPKRDDYSSYKEYKKAADEFYEKDLTPKMEKWLEENAEKKGYIFIKEVK